MIIPSFFFFLQTFSRNSKAKDHTESLNRRLKLWKEGDFDDLVRVVRFIQFKLIYQNSPTSTELMAKNFNNFMLSEKVNAALRLLSETKSAGILPNSKRTVDPLKEKHPVGAPKCNDLLRHGPEELYEEYAYKEINGALIYKIAHEIKGAACPSNLEANRWRRILTSSSFGDNSRDLYSTIGLMSKKLCLKRYCGNDGSLEALACTLIPLNKNPGVRPIEIGKIKRRILGRAVMTTFRRNILQRAGDLQHCAGQCAGCETAAYILSSTFSEDDGDVILLVDANNAFNRINQNVMIHNIRIICLIIATYVINSYSRQARLFISGGEEITSAEGTTRGDPTAKRWDLFRN